MLCEMLSLSLKISAKFLVPSTFRSVVAASSRVEWLQNRAWVSGGYAMLAAGVLGLAGVMEDGWCWGLLGNDRWGRGAGVNRGHERWKTE